MSEETPTSELVQRKGNVIYFYDEITDKTALQFITLLKEAEEDAMWNSLKYNKNANVLVHLNSPGGSVFSAFTMIDAMEYIRIPVCTLVTGAACSAAAIVALAGTQRLITPNAYIMIHSVSNVAWGTTQQLEDEVYITKQLHKRIAGHIYERTLLKKKEIKRRMKRDWWINAQQAIEDGFVQGVWDGKSL